MYCYDHRYILRKMVCPMPRGGVVGPEVFPVTLDHSAESPLHC